MYRLENWTCAAGRVMGNVYNHLQHKNGTEITTSKVIAYDKANKVVLTASGSHYILGKPIDEQYEQSNLELLEQWTKSY